MVYNFSAGPGMLPASVLEEVQSQLLSYEGSGVSIVEMSHRSSTFMEVVHDLEHRLRRLMHIPDTYAVLFLQGGATLQFSMVPMNLRNSGRFAYLDSGTWSKKAMQDAKPFGDVVVVGSSASTNYKTLPDWSQPIHDVDYLHLTLNNTIEGTRYTTLPETNVPLVADVSSNILAEPIDVERFGLLYAGAQKNIGPAGLTVVIVRRDLLQEQDVPSYLSYARHVDTLLNTPATFSLYVAERVLAWVEAEGGVSEMERRNREKSERLYDALDSSTRFRPLVTEPSCRSLTNIPFTTGDDVTDEAFRQFAQTRGLIELGGHRSVGGLRASLYNAMPLAGVNRLIETMQAFEQGGHDVSH
ncbi:3-phosphoserine/phosphohydroxythreonine transaminase [Exiguobacterium himgiriensis]|uniref:3-phosphoserine/phosphohydroxythreonine transaminase n=1 Tax=Exiguobacterium sp. s122 TaxID=2751220 RepID=UPI0021AEDCF1|nr:3-phosphoserine/phosphohydroxythreonine transaminase [Exiguobacterium himgiriensis]MCT4782553.1 3-phosphoserine/phosphohydroxythreonine transaminase [Exiguobacterium himgiriensis]